MTEPIHPEIIYRKTALQPRKITMAKKPDPKKNMTAEEKATFDRQHSVEYITTIFAGGEHLRAAALAAEADFPQSKLDELSEKCPGIIEHMPADRGDVRPEGTVPGDPVADAIQRDEPSGHPSNDGIDKPTLHPAPAASGFNDPLDHDGNGVKGGVKKA